MAERQRPESGSYHNMGDIFREWEDQMESYWRHVTPGNRTLRPRFPQMPKEDFGDDPQWRMLKAFAQYLKELMTCGTYHVTRPLWIDPPRTGRGLDAFNNTGVTLPLAGTVTTIITIDIPDRYVGILRWFGHELENPAAFAGVTWTMRINDRPLEEYTGFTRQLGRFVDPTRLPQPLILPWQGRFTLEGASTDGADHTAFARFQGWMFPAREVTGDGTYREFHTV